MNIFLKVLIFVTIIVYIPILIVFIRYRQDCKGAENIQETEKVPKSENFGLEKIKFESGIPKVIYRTHKTKEIMDNFKEEFNITSKNCKDYENHFFTNEECEDLILKNFSERIYNAYTSINPSYGACRADLFRYLIIYLRGGIYLDIKSVVTDTIDDILEENPDKMLVHHPVAVRYLNAFSSVFPPWGEYNQWSIVSPKGHPMLRKIIEKIVYNIELESKRKIKRFSGGLDVLTLTGPYMYTKVITDNKLRGVKEIGFNFNDCFKKTKTFFTDYKSRYGDNNTHYYKLTTNIIS